MNISGILYIIFSSIAFSLVGIFSKPLLEENNSLSAILLIRFLLTLLILLPFVSLKELFSRQALREILSGGLFYFLTTVLYISSIPYIGVGLATVFCFIFPIYIFIFGIIKKEIQLTISNIFILLVSFLGMLLMSYEKIQNTLALKGILLALGCGFIYALYIYSNKSESTVNKLDILYYQLIGSGIYSIFLTVFDPPYLVLNLNFIINIIALSVIGTILSLFFLIKAVEKIGPFNASILALTEPIFAVLFSYLFINEKISVLQITGLFLIITSCFFTIYLPMRKTEKREINQN